jgi:hypothetical protein
MLYLQTELIINSCAGGTIDNYVKESIEFIKTYTIKRCLLQFNGRYFLIDQAYKYWDNYYKIISDYYKNKWS